MQRHIYSKATAHGYFNNFIIFSSMWACENAVAQVPRKRSSVELGGIRFTTVDNATIPHSSRDILFAHNVTITFVDQKNREKMEKTTFEEFNDPLMNPVIQAARISWSLC